MWVFDWTPRSRIRVPAGSSLMTSRIENNAWTIRSLVFGHETMVFQVGQLDSGR